MGNYSFRRFLGIEKCLQIPVNSVTYLLTRLPVGYTVCIGGSQVSGIGLHNIFDTRKLKKLVQVAGARFLIERRQVAQRRARLLFRTFGGAQLPSLPLFSSLRLSFSPSFPMFPLPFPFTEAPTPEIQSEGRPMMGALSIVSFPSGAGPGTTRPPNSLWCILR